jgi:hypothetical protein
MKPLPSTSQALIVRTHYSDQAAWEAVWAMIIAPSDEFYADLEVVDDAVYAKATVEALVGIAPGHHTYLFVADHFTMSHPEHPVLCVDLLYEPGRSFRALPSEVAPIDNNLSIANMDFEDWSETVDADGIFRGFGDF